MMYKSSVFALAFLVANARTLVAIGPDLEIDLETESNSDRRLKVKASQTTSKSSKKSFKSSKNSSKNSSEKRSKSSKKSFKSSKNSSGKPDERTICVEVCDVEELSTFCELLEETNLCAFQQNDRALNIGNLLNDPSALVTVFAPTNSAFLSVDEDLSTAQLERILLGHIILDEAYELATLVCDEEYETALGENLSIRCQNEVKLVEGLGNTLDTAAEITGDGQFTANGSFLTVDAVILPSPVIPTLSPSSASPSFGETSISPSGFFPSFGDTSRSPFSTTPSFGETSISPSGGFPSFGDTSRSPFSTTPSFGETSISPSGGFPSLGDTSRSPFST